MTFSNARVTLAVRSICAALLLSITLPARGQSAPTTAPAAAEPTTATTGAPGALRNMSLEELMNQEVTTVTRTTSTVGQSAAAVFVITPEMIQRSGALTIPELFRMVPGMDVAQVNASTWAISARGFSSAYGASFQNNLLVQVDGQSVYNPIFAGVFWDTVDYPLADIERIEVVRGPGGTVWGANAVNGVINIITKSADQTQGGFLKLGGGTATEGIGELRYGGKLGDDTYYRVYGKGIARDDDFDTIGDPHDAWNAQRGGFRIDSHPNDPNRFTLQGDYFNSDARGFSDAATPAPIHFVQEDSEISNGGSLLGRWTHQVSADSSWSLQTYWNYAERDDYADVLNLRWSTYDLDFQHNFSLDSRNKVNYGLEFRSNEGYVGPSAAEVLHGASRSWESTYSGFVQDQIEIVPDRLALTLGTKLEYNTFTGFEYQPSGRLLWTPDSRQSVWGAISRAVRTPDVFEHGTTLILPPTPPVFPHGSGFLLPNSGLDSETVIAYELGYRRQLTDTISFDTAAYYNDYTKIAVAVPETAFGIPLAFQNRMRGKSYGVEIGANWKPLDWWQLRTAYTFQEVELHADPHLANVAGASAAVDDASAKQTPQNQIYLQSGWDLPHNVEVDLIGRYVERTGGFNATPSTVPSYITLDARLAWKPRDDLELAVVGQNLIDNHHPEFTGASTVELRRSVYGTVTYRW